MYKQGFALPAVFFVVVFVLLSISFILKNNIQTYPSLVTQKDSELLKRTPAATINPIPTTFSNNSFSLTASSERGDYVYTFTFNKQSSDSIDLAVNPYDISNAPRPVGVNIYRGDVKLTIKVSFEGFTVVYEDIPEHVIVNNLNFTKETITRIKSPDTNTYVYTSAFEIGPQGCSHMKPQPAACGPKSIGTEHEVFYISCETVSNVSTCDDIFKSLSFSRVMLK